MNNKAHRGFILSLFISLMLPFNGAIGQNIPQEIVSPQIFSENEVEAVSPFQSFESVKVLDGNDIEKSHFFTPLNREWRHKRLSGYSQMKSGEIDPACDFSKWQKIQVPLNSAPLPSKAMAQLSSQNGAIVPQRDLPTVNGINLFHTTFAKPLTWDERQMFLNLEGVAGALFVYVNGQRVGYSEDCSVNGTFDITQQCKDGLNSLVLVCYDYSTTSFLTSGLKTQGNMISKMPYIYSRPKLRVADVTYSASLDPTFTNGLLTFRTIVKTHYLNGANIRVFFDFFDNQNNLLESSSKEARLDMGTRDTLLFTVSVENVKKWCSETPNLYRARVRVQREMRFTEAIDFSVGFREFEMKDNSLYVNGVKTMIKGVNFELDRNIFDHQRVKSSLLELKKLGVNSLRLSKVADSRLYQLCDSLGFYLWAQTNISGQIGGKSLRFCLANQPQWHDMVLFQSKSLYEKVKNHPSLLFFSMGEKSGNGYNMYEAFLSLKELKKDMFVLYGDGRHEWNNDIFTLSLSKLADIETIKPLDSQPVIFDSISDDLLPKFGDIFTKLSSKKGLLGGYAASWVAAKSSSECQAAFANFSTELVGDSLVVTNNLASLKLDECDIYTEFYNSKKRGEKMKVVLTPLSETKGFVKIDFGRMSKRKKYFLELIIEHKESLVELHHSLFDVQSQKK